MEVRIIGRNMWTENLMNTSKAGCCTYNQLHDYQTLTRTRVGQRMYL